MDITEDLRRAREGDAPAATRIVPLVYEELRRLASRYLGREAADHTLQPTALVHEAYLRLVDQTRAQYHDHDHFIAVAATAMRRILVDHARRRAVARRDAAVDADASPAPPDPLLQFLAIDESLDRLATRSPRQARVVELRYFAGLGVEETARVLGVSETTVKSDWSEACATLRREWSRAEHEA